MKTLFRLTLLLWTIFSIAGIAQAGSLVQTQLVISQGSNNHDRPIVGSSELFGALGGSGTGDYYWIITGPATILVGGNQGDTGLIIKYTGAGDVTISLYKLPDTNYMIASTSLIKTAINNPPNKASISASSTNITVGDSITFTVAASDPDNNLDRLNLDVISPNNGFFQANAGPYTFDGNPPNNGGYTFPWTASKVQNCTVTFTNANTYQFRTATGDGVLGWYSPSYSDPVTVYVNKASPGISFSSTGNMNVGGSTTLSASTSGGYNPTGGFSYSVISQNGATAHVSGSTLYIDGLTSAPGQVTVRATYNGDGNNNSNYADQVVTVNPIAVTLTSSTSQGFSYDGSAKTPTVSWSAGSGYSVSSGTASATNTGNYSVTVSANYPYSGSGTISYSISKATPTISWATPAAISYGTALSATQLNASTGIAGTYTYTPVSGTVLGAGSQTLSVHFVPTDTTNYNTPSDNSVSLTVNKVGANVPTVSASANPVALGSSVTFTPGNGTTNNYAWFINGTQVTSGTGGTWSPTSGSYANGSWYTSGFNLIVTPSNTTGFPIVFRDTGNSNYNYTDSATLNETVSNSAPVVSSFSASPSTINFGQTAAISATITDSNSNLYAFAIMRFDGSNYYRLPGVDQSRGWGNSYSIDTTSGTYSSQPSNDVASGSTSTWSFNFRPSSATSTQFHANGHDGIAWAGGTQYITLTVNKATQSLSTLSNQNFTYGTPISASWLNVVASNPYSGAVTAPAAVTYTASSYGAISAGTVLPVGTYTITATSAADGNYTGNTTTATFTVNKTTPTVSWSTPAGITYGTALSGTQLNATASVPGSFSYSPASGAVLGAGTQSLSVNFTPTDTANYNSVNGTTVSLSISKASLSVTANSPSVSFTGSAYAGTPGVTYSGFVNGDTSAVVSGSPTYSYSPVSPTNAGSYTITPAIGTLAAANYTFSFVSGTLSIGKITPTLSWSTPAAITYGTALSATQLNASASVAGTYTYTPGSGTVLGYGSQTLSVHFVPTDTTNYNTPTDATVSVTVNKAALTMTGAYASNKQYDGTSTATVTAGTLVGVQNADTLTVSGTTGTFPSAAAGENLVVTPAFSISGAKSANYTFSQPSLTAHIYPAIPTSISNSTFVVDDSGTNAIATQGTFHYGQKLKLTTTGNATGGWLSRITQYLRLNSGPWSWESGQNAYPWDGGVYLTMDTTSPSAATTSASRTVYLTPTAYGTYDINTEAWTGFADNRAPLGWSGSGIQLWGGTFYYVKTTPVINFSNSTISYGTTLSGLLNAAWKNPYLSSASSTTGTTTYTASATSGGTGWTNGSAVTNATVLPAGVYTVTANVTADTNYNASSGTATFTVNALASTVTGSLTYGTVTYGSTAATATVPTATNATISYSSSDTSIATVNSSSGLITPVKAGSVVITANITPSTNYAYTGSAITANVTVNKATPTWTWVPTTLDEATPLSAAQLNATASVPGTFTYNPSSGTLAGGDQTLTAHFVPTDSNYNEVDATANITVLKVPTINWTISTGAGQFTSTDKTTISESAGFTADQLNATVSYGGTDVTASGTGKYFSVPKNAYVTTGTTMYGNRGYGILRFTWSATGYKTVSLEKTILVDTPATLVSMSASLPTVVVGQPVTVTATASDVDGNLNRIAVAIAGPKYEALYTGGAAAITPTPYLGLHWLQEGAVDIFTYTGSNTVTRTVTPTLVGAYYGNMQAATSYYWTANYATSLCSFNAIAASPTVTFSALPNSMAVGASTSMSASITGGYNPSGSIAYSITSQNGATASISGNTLTINSRTAASATITVRAAYAGDTNNNSCYADQVVTVDQITPTVTWTTPQSVNEGFTLAAVLNAGGSVPGAISYKEGMATVDASTVLAAGAHTLTATLNPTDSLTYNTASTTATVYVLKIPSISWTLSATTYNSGLININKVPVTAFSGSSSSAMPMLGAVFTSGATTLTTADGTFVYTNETNSNAVVTTGTPMAIPGNNVLRVTFTPKAGVNVYASATTTATVFVNQQPTVSITALDNATSTTNQIVIGQKVKIVTTITDADSNMSNAVVLWSGPQASAENTGTGLGTFPTTGGYWYALGYPPFTASYSLSTSIKTTSVLGTHYVSYQVKDVSSWLNAYTTASATFDVIQASPTVSFNALASMEAGSSVTMSAATAGGYNPTGAITYSVQTQTSATAHVSGSALIIDSVTGTSGTIKVRATYPGDTNNTSAYAEQTITVYPALSIATQPVSQNKSTGTALGAISVVAANGSTPYTYQWYSNTTNSTSGATLLSGATSSSYTPTDTAVGTYYYFVKVTDALAVTATSNVTSQVIVPKPVAGITATKTTVNYGESTTITMTATEGLPGTISQHSMVWDSGLNHIWTGIGTSGWGYPSDTTNLTGISDQTNSPTGANSSTKTATYTPTFLGSTVFRSWAYNNASPAAQNGTQITITTVASTPVVQNWANKSITATSGTYTVQASDLTASFVNAYNVAFPAPVGAVTYKDQSNNTITVGSVLTAGSTYTVTATVPAETNYLVGSAAVTWTVSKGPQPTLTLVANSSMTYPIAQNLSTTGGAGSGSVTYTIVSGPGSVSGNVLTPTGAGIIVVHANKAADGQYDAISSADVSITVAKAVATVSINPTTSTIELGQSATFTATSSSGNVAWSGAATGSGATKTVTPATVGTFTVTVTDNGDSNYSASTSTSATLTVTAKTDTIATITSNAGTSVVVGSQITLPVTTGNGVALTYTIKSNGISVPGTWVGNVFTLTQRLLSSNATLDVSATSVGDTNNKAISKSVQFTFTNNAPVVVVKTP